MKFFVLRGVGVIALTVVVSATGLPQTTTTTKHSKHDRQQTNQQQNVSQQTDSTFLQNALESNSAEVEIARIAQTKSQNPQVRQFADMIVQDHTEAMDRIRKAMNNGTADQTSGSVPLSAEHQMEVTKLSRLSGTAFDREFINMMVQDHRKDIHNFEMKAGTSTTAANMNSSANPNPSTFDKNTVPREKPSDDTSVPGTTESTGTTEATGMTENVGTIAKDMLPILRNHLTQAETLQRTIKK